MARLEDSHWRNKVSQEVQRIEPDLFVVLFQCTGVSPLSLASSNWLTQLVTEQKGCVLVLDEVSSRRWEDLEGLEFEDGRHLGMYYARGDLCIGTCTQGIGEVLCEWASQDHSVYYSPISIDTVHEHEDFGALIMTVLQEYLQVQELQAAFPAETQIEENFEQGTLDRVLDESGQEEEHSLLYRDPQQDQDDDLLETLPLAGFPKTKPSVGASGPRSHAERGSPLGDFIT